MASRLKRQKKPNKKAVKKPSRTPATKPAKITQTAGRAEQARPGLPDSPVWPVWPVWYDALSPLGSAVRHVASLSPKFNWVGIYKLKGKTLVLGPYIGAKTEHTRIAVGQGVCGTAVAEERDQNVPDVRASNNYLACSLETRSELVVLIRNSAGKIVGQIDIDSHSLNAFRSKEEQAVKKIAQELGERWPA